VVREIGRGFYFSLKCPGGVGGSWVLPVYQKNYITNRHSLDRQKKTAFVSVSSDRNACSFGGPPVSSLKRKKKGGLSRHKISSVRMRSTKRQGTGKREARTSR